MANLNKVMLIGRLTRDPEVRTFSNGGKVAKIGFAVNNRKKNQQTGQWDNDPVFIDAEVFNRGENGRQADLAESNLRKGHQVFIEGHLRMDNWTSQDGQKRSKLVVVIDNFQYLEPRGDGGMGEGNNSRGAPSAAPRRQDSGYAGGSPAHYDDGGPEPSGSADDIPF
jgi:single-strand DNA-binding protein